MPRKPTGAVVARKTNRGTVFALRFTAYGERQYVTLGGAWEGWTQGKADDELTVTMAQIRKGVWQPPVAVEPIDAADDDPTFHEFASEWFEAKKLELRESTIERYLMDLSCLLLPYFKDHRLSQITVAEVDRYRDAMVRQRDHIARARERGDTTRRPAGNETINKTLVRLGSILDVALERGLILQNPVKVNPRNRKLKTTTPRRTYLDQARQIIALLDAAEQLDNEARANTRHVGRKALLATPTFSSLRLGEVIALEWDDLDLAGGWIIVNKSKTDAGVRKTKLQPVLRCILNERKGSLPPAQRDGLIFGTASGKPHSPSNVRRLMAAVCERANANLADADHPPLPPITPHSLRRTWCSVMFALGESIPNVMADGGWANPNLPLRIYAQTMRRDPGENARLKALVQGDKLHHGTFAVADGQRSLP
jgi:integrase